MAYTFEVSSREAGTPYCLGSTHHTAVMELAAIAEALPEGVNVSSRDVHTWVDGQLSWRKSRKESGLRRRQSAEALFGHSATPALASWLLRHAPPAHMEVALAEAHRVVAGIRAGQITPGFGAARLRTTSRRTWRHDQSNVLAMDPVFLPDTPPVLRREDSLASVALGILRAAGIVVSPPLANFLEGAVDQAVDYLADEAARSGSTGVDALCARQARHSTAKRRMSNWVASGFPEGKQVRAILEGPHGLVAYALRVRSGTAAEEAALFSVPSEVVRGWAVRLAEVERSLVRADVSADDAA